MAYAAVTSLKQTIHLLLASSRTSLTSSTHKTLKSARWAAKCLVRTLIQYNKIKNSSQGVLAVDARIRDEASSLEDQIESHAAAQFLEQSQSHCSRFSLNLDHLTNDIHCFVEKAKKLEAEYMEELHKKPSPHPHQEVSDAASAAVSSSTNGGRDDRIVSLDSFLEIRDGIVEESHKDGLNACGITGMAGIGKTTFAKKLFTDLKEMFECRAFVTLGQKNYDFKQILRAIIAQLNVDSISSRDEMIMGGDENIYQYFIRSLSGRKFLIVLDDLWSSDGNFEKRLQRLLLAENSCSGTLLVTSRNEIRMIGSSMDSYSMPLLDEEESWELLQWKVFGEGGGYCPPQLVKAGKKIAKNCDGLPLLIVTVAKHLLTAPLNLEYWNEVAEMKNKSVFNDSLNEIYDLLLLSYHYVNQNLKACFLYMGVFPQNYVVRSSRIMYLWHAERFAYGFDRWTLDDLVSSNLVVIRQRRFSGFAEAKGWNLHVVYRHLSKREGENDKFISILDSYVADGSIEPRIRGKRLLAIHHNTLLAIEEVCDSIASLSTLRSLLCTGPYHQYQVPVCFELRLLRVLDALTIRFYEFPVEVVKLIHLRYLSLTTNANLPPFITKLWFLQCLIVHQHLIIKSTLVESYVPVEIWELKELMHLQIVGRNLPHPPPGTILPNLARLLDVGAQTCVKGVLESLPKLEKLRVQIELVPHAESAQPQLMNCCFDHISCLENLASLQSVIINPYLLHAIPPRLSSDCFRSMKNITKLSLSGFGYPWEYMSIIAELPNLEGLKLKSFAFRGEKWEAEEMIFSVLYDLVIEDTDLVQWKAVANSFPRLKFITLGNCHKLIEIPKMRSSTSIKLIDCNPIVEGMARNMSLRHVSVHHSWEY